MFYSHQLLARKAPLGQIWMAATMHAKINRKKLNKLNIIRICEEILNPSVPMALRLSGILMGGVVIVYERKVKLLYDDVTRLLVAPDPTVLPKGKSQARKEAVTLPENQETDVGEIEQSLNYSNAATTTMGFQQTAYFTMRLDNVDEPEGDASHHLHQADADNITLFERFDSYQADADAYNRFERFDIEGDEETQIIWDIPTTLIPSPHKQDEAQRAEENQDHHPEFQVNQQFNECKGARQDQQKRRPIKRKTRRQATTTVDYEQTIIPGHVYQSWIQNASDIVSRRGRKRKACMGIMSTTKISNLMELPPTVLIDDNGNREIYYPAPLLELWNKSTQPPHDSPSERTSAPPPPEPSKSSPQGVNYQDTVGYTFDDVHSGVGSQSLGTSIEKLRTNVVNDGLSMDILMEELKANLGNNGVRMTEANMATPRNSGDGVGSIPSSGSGHGIPPHYLEVNLGRKKGRHSSSRHSGSSLETVVKRILGGLADPNFELSRLSENGPTPDQELLVETEPTQTQHLFVGQPVDKIADSIRMSPSSRIPEQPVCWDEHKSSSSAVLSNLRQEFTFLGEIRQL
ncbi:sister chromatid cohesion 1 protein 1 isoform X2 [Populus alba x Populus x berolinensis]|uniref:Sister chromatid cohesion 1 protein 1 isoform X2 n=1 Tax=Populus alba x Populus x berolinensis TaxID=444605 RepID=A0AAD6MKQ2_9ROSI|nr:sister chromatid cohesion 1 protein 1 isoform X2 [Populus alba x Populus x berolinensis]